jgi:hypothetical protein
MVEKSYLGMVRVLVIILIRVILINVYLSLVFRVTLELFSFKIFIYLFVLRFLLLSMLTNINYKFYAYDKLKNLKEV